MNAVDGATTEPRIRINRPASESARCKDLRARLSPEISLHHAATYNTFNVQNAILFQPQHTEPFVRRLSDMWHAAVAVA